MFLKEPTKPIGTPTGLLIVPITFILICFTTLSYGEEISSDLIDLSIEELLTISVTTVSKTESNLTDTSASVFVITSKDIHRSGAETIPDLLRMVPGLTVASINASTWAITARGFNDRWANKLLVMIDGRTVYSPLFSGTNWDELNILLEDIERIEVVKGPGGTIWGANAVNGIVNIITKHSSKTKGIYAFLASGNTNHNDGGFRYGTKLSNNASMRAYIKFSDAKDYDHSEMSKANDRWKDLRAGFRADWDLSGKDSLMITGSAYDSETNNTVPYLSLTSPMIYRDFENNNSGSSFNLKWNRTLSPDSGFSMQTSYTGRNKEYIESKRRMNTYEIDFSYFFSIGKSNKITWGLGNRHTDDEIEDTFAVSFSPDSLGNNLYSGFIQDEINFGEDFKVTAGIKIEDSDFSGTDTHPSIRALWKLNDNNTLWAGATHSVRQVSRTNSDVRINIAVMPSPPAPATTIISIFGNKDIMSEKLTAYELGYRGSINKDLTLDISSFYNIYDDLTTTETGTPYPEGPNFVIPLMMNNLMYGETYGGEVSINIQASKSWKLRLGYSYLKMAIHMKDESTNFDRDNEVEENAPNQQAFFNSYIDLTKDLELNTSIYYMDSLPNIDIPHYTRLDVMLGWRPTDNIKINLIGQNLTDKSHLEFISSELTSTEVPRSIFGKISLIF